MYRCVLIAYSYTSLSLGTGLNSVTASRSDVNQSQKKKITTTTTSTTTSTSTSTTTSTTKYNRRKMTQKIKHNCYIKEHNISTPQCHRLFQFCRNQTLSFIWWRISTNSFLCLRNRLWLSQAFRTPLYYIIIYHFYWQRSVEMEL